MSNFRAIARHVAAALVLSLIIAAPGVAQTVVTELTDPTGDDHGPGTYVYPTNAVFEPGVFDVARFRVIHDGSNVHFDIQIEGPLTNPFGSVDGFSLQTVDIYIDTDGVAGSGSTQTINGRNVTIAGKNAWDKLVWVLPSFDGFSSIVLDPDGTPYFDGISASVDLPTRTIRLTAPVTAIGVPQTEWRYIVAMMGEDGFSDGRIRPVDAAAGEWHFGGGDDGIFDANVVDLVLAPGMSQEGMLGRYDPAGGVMPILFAAPDGVAPTIAHTPVALGEEHRPIRFDAVVTDEVVAGVWARYRSDFGPFTTLPMERVALDSFRAVITGAGVTPGTIEYFLVATDGVETATVPPDTTAPFSITVDMDVTPPAPEGLDAQPDPFSPNGDQVDDTTEITFELPEPATVDVTILDAAQQAKRALISAVPLDEGAAAFVWDGRDDGGQVVADGVYTVGVDAVDLAQRSATASTTVAVETTGSPRRLDVVFLFHFNQNLVPYSRVGNVACYVGLLQTLRAHPQSKFLVHISGPLIQSLLWFDPTAIELIRNGVADGQFEIVGSTYIQNIMYSTRSSDTDFQQNDVQIKLHKELLQRVFGVTPVSFWNCERVWTQNFVQLLADNGYETVQIEDHILESAPISGSEHLVRTTSYGGHTVNVFNDDKAFLGTANFSIDSGNVAATLDFLDTQWNADTGDEFVITYHEDAEATGLWDYEAGEDPSVDWGNLDALLTAIESDGRFQLTTYSEWLAANTPAEDVSPVPDGAADWMGRDAWFLENAHPNYEAFRSLFDTVRDSLNATGDLIASAAGDTTAAGRLLAHAWRTFAAHQYEFGVAGATGNDNGTDWQMVRSALVGARAARHALGGLPAAYMVDVNDDPEVEVVLATGTDMVVLSPRGGRLLYWFDLESGVQLVGNENFMYYLEGFVTDSRWQDTLAGGAEVYPWLAGNPVLPEVFTWSFDIRRRGLADVVRIDGNDQGDLRNALYVTSIDVGTAVFERSLAGGVSVAKRIQLDVGAVHVEYGFSGDPADVELEVASGLSPDLDDVMDGGRAQLAFWDGDTTSVFHPGVTGVVNTRTGDLIDLDLLTQPASLDGGEVVFGLRLSPVFAGTVPGGGELSFSFDLERRRVVTTVGDAPAPAPPLTQLGPSRPNPFNPSTDIPFFLPARSGSASDYELAIFDVHGRLVRVLARGPWGREPVTRVVRWDGRGEGGRPQSSGTYFARLRAEGVESTLKLVMLR